ncbi:gas vesicle protein GvpC [Yersinia pseudotuberculosis]
MSVGIICSTGHCLGRPAGRLFRPSMQNNVNQFIHRLTEERAAQSVLAV